jgi:hypothetical protein
MSKARQTKAGQLTLKGAVAAALETIQPSKLRAPNGRLSQRKSSGGIERPRRLFAPTEWRAIFTNRQVNPYL